MLVTLFGMVIEIKLLQLKKALVEIDVILFGIVMVARLEQPEKISGPIDVTLGIVTEVKSLLMMNL